jgi:hypothetical protein
MGACVQTKTFIPVYFGSNQKQEAQIWGNLIYRATNLFISFTLKQRNFLKVENFYS